MTREDTLVELVDTDGTAVGSATVADAHTAPGRLHRAFSVLLFDPAGRLLLQQRAASKTRFALRWANACCGHPGPGEDVASAANRRVAEELGLELGLSGLSLTATGVYVYRAVDTTSQRVEHEYDHVLVGRVPSDPPLAPHPGEVAALRWVDPGVLDADLRTDPPSYAPWLAGVMSVWTTTSC